MIRSDHELPPWYSFSLQIFIQIVGFAVPYYIMHSVWAVSLVFEFEPPAIDASDCFTRSIRTNCMFGIDESVAGKFHIMVINSTSVMGLAITSQLRSMGFSVIELRTDLQFDTSKLDVFELLPEPALQAVVDLSTTTSVVGLGSYLSAGKLFKIVEEYVSIDLPVYQIKIPPVWGPSIYMGRLEQQSWIDQCMDYGNTIIESNASYAFSGDVSSKVAEIIVNELEHSYKDGSAAEVSVDLMRVSDIVSLLRSRGCKVTTTIPASKVVKKATEERFKAAWTFAERQRLPRSEPYASHAVVISDNQKNAYRYQKVLDTLSEIMEMAPYLPIEFLCIFCQVKSTSKFYEIFNVSASLKRFLRVVEIPRSFYESQVEKYNVSYFPEYIFRNIGVRRAKGEYIIVGSGDVIPPIEFFEAVATRSFSMHMYIRSERRDVNPDRDIVKLAIRNRNIIERRQTLVTAYAYRFQDLLERNACGDFQGAHRNMWWHVNSYVEGRYVFHVDSLLAMDFTSCQRVMLVNMIGNDLHVEHTMISHDTDHFPFFSVADLTRKGMCTAQFSEWARPEWGAKDVNFVEY